jgi:hypothetical protein
LYVLIRKRYYDVQTLLHMKCNATITDKAIHVAMQGAEQGIALPSRPVVARVCLCARQVKPSVLVAGTDHNRALPDVGFGSADLSALALRLAGVVASAYYAAADGVLASMGSIDPLPHSDTTPSSQTFAIDGSNGLGTQPDNNTVITAMAFAPQTTGGVQIHTRQRGEQMAPAWAAQPVNGSPVALLRTTCPFRRVRIGSRYPGISMKRNMDCESIYINTMSYIKFNSILNCCFHNRNNSNLTVISAHKLHRNTYEDSARMRSCKRQLNKTCCFVWCFLSVCCCNDSVASM